MELLETLLVMTVAMTISMLDKVERFRLLSFSNVLKDCILSCLDGCSVL